MKSILKVKDWIKLRNNSQFEFIGVTTSQVKRLSDGVIFITGKCQSSDMKIDKFHEDMIHVTLLSMANHSVMVPISNLPTKLGCYLDYADKSKPAILKSQHENTKNKGLD